MGIAVEAEAAQARPDLRSSTMSTLLIANGRVIDPASDTDTAADVLIEHGRIARIGPNLPRDDADRVIDACGCLVTPGLIDPHVHFREPGQEHKETIQSGSEAAVAGGFTTVCCMPNTTPAIDSVPLIRFIHDRAEQAACRVFAVAAATKGRAGIEPTEFDLLASAGAVAFSDDGDVIADAGVMYRIMRELSPLGMVFMQHCQEPSLTRGASMHAGSISTRLGLGGWPRMAEELIIARDLRLVEETGCRYHIQHISSGGSVELVRRARAAGLPVSAEASPHHLLLTHEACADYNTNAKMNPPLREQADIDAIAAGVADGTISILATDHAPHAAHEKQLPFQDAPFGIVGLDTALPIYIKALIDTKTIDWPELIGRLTIEPARLCNLDRSHRDNDGLGELYQNGPADLTIINPDLTWTITENDIHSKSTNCPFLGMTVTGKAITTIVGGQVVYEHTPR